MSNPNIRVPYICLALVLTNLRGLESRRSKMVLFRTLAIAGVKHFLACALVHIVCNVSPLLLPMVNYRRRDFILKKAQLSSKLSQDGHTSVQSQLHPDLYGEEWYLCKITIKVYKYVGLDVPLTSIRPFGHRVLNTSVLWACLCVCTQNAIVKTDKQSPDLVNIDTIQLYQDVRE